MNVNRFLAATVISAAAIASTGGIATAAEPGSTHSASSVQESSGVMTATETTDQGLKVTFTVDEKNKQLIIQPEGQAPEHINLTDAALQEITGVASDDVISPLVSKETCANLLSGAGYANGIVWGLAAAVSSPTVAGAIIAMSAGAITSAMITEAGRLC